MEESAPAEPIQTPPAERSNSEDIQRIMNPNSNAANSNGTGRPTQPNNRSVPVSSTPRDFEGATPKIGGILALRSENMTK